MKVPKYLTLIALAACLAAPALLSAADSKGDKKAGKAKPYPLKTCVVSDEKLA